MPPTLFQLLAVACWMLVGAIVILAGMLIGRCYAVLPSRRAVERAA